MLFSDLAVGSRFKVVERGENYHAEVIATVFTKIEEQQDAPWSGRYNAVSTNEMFPDMWVRPFAAVEQVTDRNGVYDIPTVMFPAINERIEELNRRGEKLGLENLLGMQTIQKRIVKDGEEEHERAIVRLTGEAPRLDGWALIAVLQHDPEAERPFFRAVPGNVVPEQYRQADPENCDHCHTIRQRKDTYIVQHQDGRTMQVGSSCLRDFLGHQSPAVLLAWAEMADDLDRFVQDAESDDAPDDGGMGGYGIRYDYLPLHPYMCHVAHIMKRDGWVSKGKAEQTGMLSTAASAFHNMRDLRKKLSHATPPTAADAELAKAAIEWAREIDPTNDYLLNINTLANMTNIPFNMQGFAASMIAAYQRATEKERTAAAQKAASRHVGTVGKREEFGPLTLLGITFIESVWGCTSLHRFADQDGNLLVWFASSETLEEGKVYQGKATVKTHDEYKGIAQTVINRCKFEQVEVA